MDGFGKTSKWTKDFLLYCGRSYNKFSKLSHNFCDNCVWLISLICHFPISVITSFNSSILANWSVSAMHRCIAFSDAFELKCRVIVGQNPCSRVYCMLADLRSCRNVTLSKQVQCGLRCPTWFAFLIMKAVQWLICCNCLWPNVYL